MEDPPVSSVTLDAYHRQQDLPELPKETDPCFCDGGPLHSSASTSSTSKSLNEIQKNVSVFSTPLMKTPELGQLSSPDEKQIRLVPRAKSDVIALETCGQKIQLSAEDRVNLYISDLSSPKLRKNAYNNGVRRAHSDVLPASESRPKTGNGSSPGLREVLDTVNRKSVRSCRPSRKQYKRDTSNSSRNIRTRESEDCPSILFNVDKSGNAMDNIQAKGISKISVFECCAVLQSGMQVLKKRRWFLFDHHFIWLSADCKHVFWASIKEGTSEEHVRIDNIAGIVWNEKNRSMKIQCENPVCFKFLTADHAHVWLKVFVCFLSIEAEIRGWDTSIASLQRVRKDYNEMYDSFNGKALMEYTAVNSYAVLSNAKKQRQEVGNKLAYSLFDHKFYGLRYIPPNLVGGMLGSKEQIVFLNHLNHPNIMKYRECLFDRVSDRYFVTFENMANGCLNQFTKAQYGKYVPEKSARRILLEMLKGLEYLHSFNIAHGDIRPENLLVGANGVVKVNAIGSLMMTFSALPRSYIYSRNRLQSASSGFLAPEQCWLAQGPRPEKYAFSADLWSCGVVLYFMIYSQMPFRGKNEVEIQDNICHGRLRFPRVPETSLKIRKVIKSVLGHRHPPSRISLRGLQKSIQVLDKESNRKVRREVGSSTTGTIDSGGKLRQLKFTADQLNNAVKHATVGRVLQNEPKSLPQSKHMQTKTT